MIYKILSQRHGIVNFLVAAANILNLFIKKASPKGEAFLLMILRTLTEALNIGKDPGVVAAGADASAIFTNGGTVKVDGCAAVGTMFVVNVIVLCGEFAECTDKGPAVGHKELFVLITADDVSGAVVGYVVNNSCNKFDGKNIVFAVFGAADDFCAENRNTFDVVGLTSCNISVDLALGFGVKFFGKVGADGSKVFCGPCILHTDVKVGSFAKEFGFVESRVALFKSGNIVNKGCRRLGRNVDSSGGRGRYVSVFDHKGKDNNYNNDDDHYLDKAKPAGKFRITIIIVAAIIVTVIIIAPAGIPAGIKSAAEIGITPVGAARIVTEISECNG